MTPDNWHLFHESFVIALQMTKITRAVARRLLAFGLTTYIVTAAQSVDAMQFMGLGILGDSLQELTFFGPNNMNTVDLDGAGNTAVVKLLDSSFVWKKNNPVVEYPHGQSLQISLMGLYSVSNDGSTIVGKANLGSDGDPLFDEPFILLRDGHFTTISNSSTDPRVVASFQSGDFIDANNDGTSFIATTIFDGTNSFSTLFWNGANFNVLEAPADREYIPSTPGEEPFLVRQGLRMSRNGMMIVGRVACWNCVDDLDPITTLWHLQADGSFTARSLAIAPVLNPFFVENQFAAVSDNGVVVGDFMAFDGTNVMTRAYRWSDSGGFQELSLPRFISDAVAVDVSADGSVVLGHSTIVGEQEIQMPLIWNSIGEALLLEDLVEANEQLMEQALGWSLKRTFRVSDDGQVIIGVGTNPFGQLEIWRLDLSTVPEAGSLCLAMLGVGALAGFRTRQRY